MSRSCRVLIAALIGLAVLYPIERPSHAESSTNTTDSGPEQNAKPIDFAPISDEIKRLTGAVESVKPEGKSADETKRDADDLTAQQDMAKWARLMYIVTALTTVLTAIGVVLLGATLYFTKRAADASDEMVRQSIIASKAAVDAAKAADLTAQSMIKIEAPIVRAMYMDARVRTDGALMQQPSNSAELKINFFDFRNYGKTPAFLTKFELGFGLFESLPQTPSYSEEVTFDQSDVIKPEPQQNGFEISVKKGAEEVGGVELDKFIAAQATFYVYCRLYFTDFLGNDECTAECWVWKAKTPGGWGSFESFPSAPISYLGSSK
jgi:hypothetical protein